uniref:ABC transporter domain-containing protein n=2 Tax=Timema TaxID=61471 RepID=A0A7R9ARH4_TIMSH|nr:unnamed protein product [Timema shepardi]
MDRVMESVGRRREDTCPASIVPFHDFRNDGRMTEVWEGEEKILVLLQLFRFHDFRSDGQCGKEKRRYLSCFNCSGMTEVWEGEEKILVLLQLFRFRISGVLESVGMSIKGSDGKCGNEYKRVLWDPCPAISFLWSCFRISGVTGVVGVDGVERDLDEFRRLSCYITQDDRLEPLLTVQENMRVAADLKLGVHVTTQEKLAIIEEILSTLGLLAARKTRASMLSGGQKKRLSIALELVNNPMVMFLDEPTTPGSLEACQERTPTDVTSRYRGLDSSSCSQCLKLLKMLARQGRTIVCTIHQPSASLFQQFDHVYVLSQGRCLYQGSTDQLVPYLSGVNLPCPLYHNPADYVTTTLQITVSSTRGFVTTTLLITVSGTGGFVTTTLQITVSSTGGFVTTTLQITVSSTGGFVTTTLLITVSSTGGFVTTTLLITVSSTGGFVTTTLQITGTFSGRQRVYSSPMASLVLTSDSQHLGKPALSAPDRDSNTDIPVYRSLAYHESSALEHAATEAGREAASCQNRVVDASSLLPVIELACGEYGEEQIDRMTEGTGNGRNLQWFENGSALASSRSSNKPIVRTSRKLNNNSSAQQEDNGTIKRNEESSREADEEVEVPQRKTTRSLQETSTWNQMKVLLYKGFLKAKRDTHQMQPTPNGLGSDHENDTRRTTRRDWLARDPKYQRKELTPAPQLHNNNHHIVSLRVCVDNLLCVPCPTFCSIRVANSLHIRRPNLDFEDPPEPGTLSLVDSCGTDRVKVSGLIKDYGPTLTHMRLGVNVMVGMMLGTLFFQAGNDGSRTLDNYNLLFSILVHQMSSNMMLSILTFPMEMTILKKEHFNRWYSLKSFYLSITIVDIPVSVISCVVFSLLVYIMTGQPLEPRRITMFLVIGQLTMFVSQTIGLMIGSIFDVVNGTFLGPTLTVPIMMFAGFGINLRDMPVYLHWGTYVSYLRFSLEGIIAAIYGDDRPVLDCPEHILYCHYKHPSKFLHEIAMNGDMFWIDLIALSTMVVVGRAAAYFLLRWKLYSVR